MKKYTHRTVRKKGKLDGRDFRWKIWPFEKEQKEPYPSLEQVEPALFENELYEAGQQKMASLTAEWNEIDKNLKSEYCQVEYAEKAQKISLEKETKDMEVAAQELSSIQKKINEFPAPVISQKTALFWLIVIAILEFPLNSVAFQILGAGIIETYLMSAGICIVLPWLGHWFGSTLKQENKSFTLKILATVVVVFSIGLILALAIFREVLFEHMKSHATLKINLSDQAAAFIFVIINLAVLLVTAILTYSSSYTNQSEYNRIKKIYKTALKVLKRECEDAEDASKEHFKKKQMLIEKREKRQKTHDLYLQKAIQIVESFEWLVHSYRTANMYARKKGQTPRCFHDEPKKIYLPEELNPENLDWNCEYQKNDINLLHLN